MAAFPNPEVDVAMREKKSSAFDTPNGETCPFSEQCPTQLLKRKPESGLRFSQSELDLALRRKRSADVYASGQNLRPAVEAVVKAVKHPFLPLFGLDCEIAWAQ